MNIVKRIDQYDENNCFFCEPIKNNVMNDGNFIRIIYSTHNFTLNGIYLLLTLVTNFTMVIPIPFFILNVTKPPSLTLITLYGPPT